MQRSRKIIFITFGAILASFFVFIGGIVLLGMFVGGGFGGCSSQITEKIPSPDNKNVAYVIERDCGATAGSTDLAIDSPGKTPTEGNVFSSDDTGFQTRWKNSHELVISYPKNAEVTLQKTTCDGIKIDYISSKPE